jgi:hypothetical protein
VLGGDLLVQACKLELNVDRLVRACWVDVLPIANSKGTNELNTITRDDVFANDPETVVDVLKDLIVSMIGTGAKAGLLKPNSLPTDKLTICDVAIILVSLLFYFYKPFNKSIFWKHPMQYLS